MNFILTSLLIYSVFVSSALYLVVGRAALKAIIVSGLFACILIFWFFLDGVRGWPTLEKPTRGFVAAIVIDEPDETDPGGIYLWVVLDGTLRNYRVPYTESEAKKAFAANSALGSGSRVVIGDGDEPGEGIRYSIIEVEALKK